ncbi:hypothetical protein [Streptomyces sp. B8F3]|uniref:hypothetical protein n=1 Tax=unclassified Streptomyces TaxID=2593676 RepID=UPI00325F70CC
MTTPTPPPAPDSRPFLELRIGGVHLVVQHVPYRLLTLMSTAAGALGGAVWVTGR